MIQECDNFISASKEELRATADSFQQQVELNTKLRDEAALEADQKRHFESELLHLTSATKAQTESLKQHEKTIEHLKESRSDSDRRLLNLGQKLRDHMSYTTRLEKVRLSFEDLTVGSISHERTMRLARGEREANGLCSSAPRRRKSHFARQGGQSPRYLELTRY